MRFGEPVRKHTVLRMGLLADAFIVQNHRDTSLTTTCVIVLFVSSNF